MSGELPFVDRVDLGVVGGDVGYSGLCGIARCGIARCGWSYTKVRILNRSKTVLERISIEIENIQWDYALNGGCTGASFKVKRNFEDAGNITQGNLIEIERYGDRVYAGIINKISRLIDIQGVEWISVECIGISSYVDDVIVNLSIRSLSWNNAITLLVTEFPIPLVSVWSVPNVSYTITNQEFKEQPFSQVMNTLVNLAQNGSTRPYYWGIDENYEGYVVAPPTSNLVYALGSHSQVRAYDLQGGEYKSLKNMLKVYGGTKTDGRQSIVQVNDATSRSLYGDKQTIISNPDIPDETDLTRWASSQVAVIGYPRSTGNIEIVRANDAFRPWLYRIQITGFSGSPSTQEHEIVTASMSVDAGQNYSRLKGNIENITPFWWEIFEGAKKQALNNTGRYFTPKTRVVLQNNNFVRNGMAPSAPSAGVFRIAAGKAYINGTDVNPVQTDLTVGTELTANTHHWIFLSSAGTYTVVTNWASKPSETTNLLVFQVDTKTLTDTIPGWIDERRMFSSDILNLVPGVTPASFTVSTDATKGDYTSIQSAINALPATGGIIYIKEGTYTLTAAITIAISNVQLIGAGYGNTIIKRGGTVASFDSMIKNSGNINDILIRGMQLDSNKTDYAGGTAYGINFAGAHERVTIEQVRFVDFQAGFTIRGATATDWRISGNFMYKGQTAINFDGSGAARSVIEGNTIDGTGGSGAVPGEILIQGDFHKVMANPLKGGARISVQGNYNNVSGNTVDSPGGVGIIVTPYATASIDRCVVSNNFVYTPPANNAGISIDTLSGYVANNTSINGNQVTGVTGTGSGVLINGGSNAVLVNNHLLGNATTYTDNGTTTLVANNKTS